MLKHFNENFIFEELQVVVVQKQRVRNDFFI